jgi:DNA-binding XRE family transcriptional regulator
VKKQNAPRSKANLRPSHSEPSEFQSWFHSQLADKEFRRCVEQRLSELDLDRQLKQRRLALGLSQSELARFVRVGQPYLAKLESGTIKNPELKTLVKAATALGCTLKIVFEALPEPRALKARLDPAR